MAFKYSLSEWLSEALTLVTVEPKTHAGYESLARFLLAGLGDVPLDSITTLDVQRFVSRSAVSASRTRQAYRLLTQVLNMAVAYEVLERPLGKVQLPRMPRRDVQCLSLAEIDSLATAAGRYGRLVKFLAFTGLRWGEAAALTHGDIHGSTVYVRRTQVDVNGHLSYGSPKSHAQRTVYLPSSFVLPPGPADALVYTSPHGCSLRCQNFARNVWKPATASVGRPSLRVHDLRHTAVSLLIQAGVHPKVIQRLMGHSSVTITMDTYGHLIGNQLEQASHALDALLASSKTDDDTSGLNPSEQRIL